MYNGIDENMITDFVATLPKRCPYCGDRCWRIDDYPYACRCSQCSSYFHVKFKTCDDLVCEGYDTFLCTEHHISALRLFELADGTLIEVCLGCIDWLYGEEFIDEYVDSANDFTRTL